MWLNESSIVAKCLFLISFFPILLNLLTRNLTAAFLTTLFLFHSTSGATFEHVHGIGEFSNDQYFGDSSKLAKLKVMSLY